MGDRPLRLLIVDDSPEDREVYRRHLAAGSHGACRFTESESGEEGLRLCRAEPPDCVLLDYSLPDLDGLEFLARLAAECGERVIPVVMLTGQGDEAVAVEALKRGAEDYLVKGRVTADGIRHAIRAAIDKAALRRQLEAQRRELERGAAALRESEARYRQLADAMPQIVWSARPDGCLDYYNERWYEFTGLARGGAGDQSWEEVLHPDDVRKCKEAWHAAVRSGQPYQIEYRFKDRRTGGHRWFLGRALPVRDDSGRVVRWLGTCTDIDDQKHTEEALKEADRRKDQFLAMLAHELRNPLAPLRNALHLFRLAKTLDPILSQGRDIMERQVLHLTRLVDDLLDVSRIVRGKIQLHLERLDLARQVRTVLEDHRRGFEQAGLRLDQELPELPVWVRGDVTRLTQALDNLLSNACKFTDRGGRVLIRLEVHPRERHANVVVRDTGIGIAPEDLPHVFESFVQADRSLDRTRGGLGLGLALVKGLVELHGGEVRAASAGPGCGAEFTLRLPTEPEPAALDRQPGPPARPAKHLRILVVEDNVDAAESLRLLLEAYGYEVTVAHSGPAGIKAAQECHPDIVLCDIGLPGMDGYCVAGALRRDPSTARTRLVAVTGYGHEEDRRRSKEAGFDAHLVKPVDPEALVGLLAAEST